ncbi:hypothetical protein DLAC_09545 [Tieghemostelium lacteum]|uniref:Uncharacterized protein n=1 Tax=Tieghemostelium lacteum TaxID=361077 RepID=A0A151Z6K8_TIELA|nr:hypothetical protein DLAC_09545 [Tieghemostelium lacteum]|eukprot:KYQ89590.1 hypothetical protein DLAC_09545 [Tieghemostelium lacteum]
MMKTLRNFFNVKPNNEKGIEGIQEINEQYVDKEKAGNSYIVGFANGKGKICHWGLLIDLAGESHDNSAIGILIHMWVEDSKLSLFYNKNQFYRNRFELFESVGKIYDISGKNNPKDWYHELKEPITQWFEEFKKNSGENWSSQCNSHAFSLYLCSKLNLQYPDSCKQLEKESEPLLDSKKLYNTLAHLIDKQKNI